MTASGHRRSGNRQLRDPHLDDAAAIAACLASECGASAPQLFRFDTFSVSSSSAQREDASEPRKCWPRCDRKPSLQAH